MRKASSVAVTCYITSACYCFDVFEVKYALLCVWYVFMCICVYEWWEKDTHQK